MPLIKLIKVHGDGWDESYDFRDMSNWEEVTEQELDILKSWQGGELFREAGTHVVVFEDITSREKIESFISDIKSYIKRQQEWHEELERKRIADTKKRKEAAEAKKLEKAKKLLKEKGLL